METMETLAERQERLHQKYPPKLRWRFLGTIMSFRFLQMGLINGAFSLILTSMIADLGMTATERAGMLSANSTGQLIATLCVGFLIDRLPAKKFMAFGLLLIASLMCIMRSFVTNYTGWLIIMFVWGYAYAGTIVCTLKFIGLWFDKKQTGVMNGYFTLSGPLGQLIAMQIGLQLINAFGGWKNYFLYIGIAMFVIFLIFLIICKERPNEDSEVPPNYDKKDTGLIKDIVAMAKVPKLWFLWLADGCQAAVIALATTYGQIVLQNDPNWALDKTVSRQASSMVMLGAVIGYFLIPRLSQMINKKNPDPNKLAYFSMVCGAVTAILYTVGYLSYNWTLLLVLLLIGGIGQGGFIVGPRALMIAQPEISGGRAGASVSISNIIGRIGTVIVTAVMGALAIKTGDSAVIMSLLYAVLFCGPISLVVFLLINKRGKKKNKLPDAPEAAV